MNETATGALVGERGCDGQAGDKEQGDDGEFGLHGELVFTSHFAGEPIISRRIQNIFEKEGSRRDVGSTEVVASKRSSAFDKAHAAADLKESWARV